MEPLDSAAAAAAAAVFMDDLLDFASDIEEDDDRRNLPFTAPAHLLPEHEDEELEWLSNKDAFPTVETFLDGFSDRPDSIFKHESPVSVLENSSSSSTTTTSNVPFTSCCGGLHVPVRARSKRVRGRRQVGPTDLPPHHLCWSESTGPKPRQMKMGRKCTHCGADKTPQWRAGPHGAKTLCNACGVRYKSGRLVPEYRPANSPTFSSVLHSNSHRKVMEMRRVKQTGFAVNGLAEIG